MLAGVARDTLGALTMANDPCSLSVQFAGRYVVVLRVAAVLVCLALGFAVGCSSGSSMSSNQNQNQNQGNNFPPATTPLTKLSTDAFTNSTSQHATEVEPGSFSFGNTIVTSFQVGRIASGGAADIGYAISTDAGATWTNGVLPGLTTFQGGGTNSAVSDTVPIYDVKHAVWMISSLPISAASTQVAVNRSTDGGTTWGNPVIIAQSADLDKDWITCDDDSASPFYGNCYMEWDDNGNGNLVYMSTSSDGGQTWSPGAPVVGSSGLGGQPLVQPGTGKVIVPYEGNAPFIFSFSSTDGGTTWDNIVQVANVTTANEAGGLRSGALPSAQEDAAGTVYVIWEDCRFRASCASNDLVMSTSSDGANWTTPVRIPIDSVLSGADHFIPGLAIDPATSGASAHLALTYYYYPQANCTATTCALYAGLISSLDGGNTWSAPTPLAGPMSLAWLPSTDQGQMVADYIATSFVAGKAFGFFAVAKQNSGTMLDQAIYTTQNGMDVAAAEAKSSAHEESVMGVGSRKYVVRRVR